VLICNLNSVVVTCLEKSNRRSYHNILGPARYNDNVLGLQSVEIWFADKISYLDIRLFGCPNIGKPNFGIEPRSLIKSCLCQNQFTNHFFSLNSTEEMG
jgi:hypothetical protein